MRLKKNSTSSNKSLNLKKNKRSESPLVADDTEDDDDDWFKAQFDEFKKQASTRSSSSSGSRGVQQTRRLSESEDDKKKSIWDWTGIHEVVNAVGQLIFLESKKILKILNNVYNLFINEKFNL